MKISRVRDFRGFGKLPAARKRKDRQRVGSADPSVLPPVPRNQQARWRPGSADPTAPEQVSQAPGLRELRLAESEQLLPPAGNRKLASDRAQWIRRWCPGRERGDRQSSVPADPTPSRTRPTGRRIGGTITKPSRFRDRATTFLPRTFGEFDRVVCPEIFGLFGKYQVSP